MISRFRSALCSGVMLLALAPVAALAQSAPFQPSTAPIVRTTIPRMPNGQPDLTGIWTPAADGREFDEETETGSNNVLARGGRMANFENDNAMASRGGRNRPLYRPQFWDTVRDKDWNGNHIDPGTLCRPPGVPRQGAPKQIVQTKDQIIFIPEARYAAGNPGYPRVFYYDGRPHDVEKVRQETWNGISVGHFEGDTLVVVTKGFIDDSWLAKGGYIHGFDMVVTERLTPNAKGDEIRYEVTVDDPEYLEQPWVWIPRTMRLNTNPNAYLAEALPCVDRDSAEMVGHNSGGGNQVEPGPRKLFGMVIPSTVNVVPAARPVGY